jgi:hypothetical protein
MRTVDTTQAGTASSATELRYIYVKSVIEVAPNCQAYGR